MHIQHGTERPVAKSHIRMAWSEPPDARRLAVRGDRPDNGPARYARRGLGGSSPARSQIRIVLSWPADATIVRPVPSPTARPGRRVRGECGDRARRADSSNVTRSLGSPRESFVPVRARRWPARGHRDIAVAPGPAGQPKTAGRTSGGHSIVSRFARSELRRSAPQGEVGRARRTGEERAADARDQGRHQLVAPAPAPQPLGSAHRPSQDRLAGQPAARSSASALAVA